MKTFFYLFVFLFTSVSFGQVVINELDSDTPSTDDREFIELKSLNQATGCRILLKCEHLNPGNSLKDRTALWIMN